MFKSVRRLIDECVLFQRQIHSHVACLAFANMRMTDYNTNIEYWGFNGICAWLTIYEWVKINMRQCCTWKHILSSRFALSSAPFLFSLIHLIFICLRDFTHTIRKKIPLAHAALIVYFAMSFEMIPTRTTHTYAFNQNFSIML